MDLTGDGGVIKTIVKEGTGVVIPARSKAHGMHLKISIYFICYCTDVTLM